MKRKILIVLMLVMLICQSACNKADKINNKEEKIYNLTERQKEIVESYNKFNTQQKQVLNFLVNDNYRYYDYLYLQIPMLERDLNTIKELGIELLNIPKYTLATQGMWYKGNKTDYASIIKVPEENKDEITDQNVEWIYFTQEQIDKREKLYIDTLNKMYNDIEGFNDLTDFQKHYFANLFNEEYKIKLNYKFYYGQAKLKEWDYVYKLVKNIYDFDLVGIFTSSTEPAYQYYTKYVEQKISDEGFERIYNQFLDDYKKFYKFLGENINSKTGTYTFEEPVYYNFAEYMVSLFFDREKTFELYKYTLDENGMVKSFTWTSIEEVLSKK
ncbi:hypothetical protein JYG23_06060 [Sedimentibacter sp. zth1]|uniref:hypothetical protein n=1 Tax=Sedimentibacter sp. zth1 TaxID=2816908 RepID=UPI001A91E30B|nr:hypothetical protein [Sedimentibacter sp. zth1]QSX06951.1 hypothetical protein JYG23_06060 [Sedimentibacter sp. zth1]